MTCIKLTDSIQLTNYITSQYKLNYNTSYQNLHQTYFFVNIQLSISCVHQL